MQHRRRQVLLGVELDPYLYHILKRVRFSAGAATVSIGSVEVTLITQLTSPLNCYFGA